MSYLPNGFDTSVLQSRTRFQIEKFVIGQHPTPEMQYRQIMMELSDLFFNKSISEVRIQKLELQIQQLESSDKELDQLSAKELKLELAQANVGMEMVDAEIAVFIDILNSSPKFTLAQIEENQFEYWKARLTNNAKSMLIGGHGVNPAHIESMQQAGVLDEFVKEVEQSKKALN